MLSRANALMRLALRGSDVGVWEIEISDGDFRLGRDYVNMFEQLGDAPPNSPADYGSAMAPVHPEDRDLLDAAIRRYLAGENGEFEIENRVQHKDGSCRWMLIRARQFGTPRVRRFDLLDPRLISPTASGPAICCASEERFRGTFDNAAVGIAHEDLTGRFLRFNKTFCGSSATLPKSWSARRSRT